MEDFLSKKQGKWWVILLIMVLFFQSCALPVAVMTAHAEEEIQPDVFIEQPGGVTNWYLSGSFQGWNNADELYRFKHLAGAFYAYSLVLDAGHHKFKITKNGSWDGFSNNGNNFALDLSAKTKVNLYVNEEMGEARITVPGVANLPYYQPSLSPDKWPRLVGTVQTVFGEAAWSPEEAKQYFVDYYFNSSVYKLQRTLPAGSYEAKVTFGPNWSENYGADGQDGKNLGLQMTDEAIVTFSIDTWANPKVLKHDYQPRDGDFDGKIHPDKISFNSRSIMYKKPFGAIAEKSQDLTLRIAAAKGDVQFAKVEMINSKGSVLSYPMQKVTTVGDQDFFEVILSKEIFTGIGVWGYKFVLIDGAAIVEYGEDGQRGGKGTVSNEGAVPFDLTVYDSEFKTPDWMKHAVVYQIFPDRFYDGEKGNNRAKLVDGYRGDPAKEPYKLQFFDGGVTNDPATDQVWGDWSSIPEKPDRPGGKTDGVWTNEFYGGDLQGVQQKLDYLKSIGVNVIYFNPIAWAASNHKYDATDYMHVDPMFGMPVFNTPGDPKSGLNYEATRQASDQVFIQFAKAAREKGIKLIVDGVFNHVGDDSIYFDRYGKYPEIGAYEYWEKVWDKVNAGKTQQQAEQEVRDEFTAQINPATGKNYQYPEDFQFTQWFTISNEKVNDREGPGKHYKYDAWWGYDSLPAVDAKEPQSGDSLAIDGQHEWNNVGYRNLVLGQTLDGKSDEDATHHMQATNSQRWGWMGAGGWRLDVAPDVSHETWVKFRDAVKSIKNRPDVNMEAIVDPIILGEEWGVATKYLLGDQFDSVMNYRFRNALQSFIIGGDASAFHEALESIREDYPKEAWQVMLNLVGSHDTTRSITKYDFPQWEEENREIAPEASDSAIAKQALTAIFQMGYPGAPTIYYGDEVGQVGTKDPDSRRTFPWERIVEQGGAFSATGKYGKLFDAYQKAATVRQSHEVFRTGDIKVAYAVGSVIAYARKNAEKGALVIINRGENPQEIAADVTGFLPDGLTLTDQLYGAVSGTIVNGKITITVPAAQGLMLVSEQMLAPMSSVSDLQATGGVKRVDLTWNAVEEATQYNVYRAAMEGGTMEKIGTTTDTQFTDHAVENGVKYYYAVTAWNGTGESELGDMVSATPSFIAEKIEITQPAENNMTIGVGKKTSEILVTVTVPGLTDDPRYVGKTPTGLTAQLQYALDGGMSEVAKLRYKNDSSDGKSKIYGGTFEPTFAGTYGYYAAVTVDNGASYLKSSAETLTTVPDASDQVPPAAPSLSDIAAESGRAALRWTADDPDIAGFEIYRKQGEGAYAKIAQLSGADRTYTDFTVTNGKTYTYVVKAYDKVYNRSASEEKAVQPDLVMVDVLLRLHLPEYTPATDDIYIAGSMNGWNASSDRLTKPSGATDRSVVEYRFKMMAGKSIQYKYTRGSWSTEALTSHARVPNDQEDYSNYGYSSTDTNMSLTVQNQGNNQMIVDDYVIRWVDMPMILTSPQHSLGSDVAYKTTDKTFTLKANVPYGVHFTINNEPLPEGAMDAYGNVEVKDIPLQPGQNQFALHIEPTEETLNQPWFTDKGRKSQATKTIVLSITREEALENNANLLNLQTSMGTLTPAFSADTLTYTMNVPKESTSMTVTPTADDPAATVKVNGRMVANGQPSEPIALTEDETQISVEVTAGDGVTKKAYVITVFRTSDLPVKLTGIEATVSKVQMEPNGSQSFHVYAIYANGEKKEITTDAQTVYKSSNPKIVHVEPGIIKATDKKGSATVTVQYHNQTVTIGVKVKGNKKG